MSPGAYEEYWYDALGRRVLKRSRQESPICTNSNRCTSTIERIVWDGDQILWEVRQADAGDTQNPSGSQYAGQTGHVGYVHAGGLDAPIAIIRNGTGVVLHRNWRGLYAAATKDNGAEVSATVYWPGVNWDLKLGYVDTRNTDDWYGSLVKGHQDRTGLTYQRNRYYDPRSGQFTQQDPIGIAGGLNLYGYANGDPINFRDPFGLCPEEQRDEDGRCPGGLEVGEWEAVEAAMEYMDSELSTKVREHLDAGRIKSSNLPQTWQGFTNPFTSTVHLNNDLPLGSALDPEVVRSTQLAFILAHEFGHVDGLSRGRLRYELGLLLSKTFFEMKADFYACSHTTAGQTINAESCLVPGR